jgi:hypothetical protein
MRERGPWQGPRQSASRGRRPECWRGALQRADEDRRACNRKDQTETRPAPNCQPSAHASVMPSSIAAGI